jgi:hypothetical protein
MEDEAKTADGRRRWQHWTEPQARAAIEELARSGLSTAKFAEAKGISAQRIAYWKKRLAEAGPTQFVPVDVSGCAASPAVSYLEIVVGTVTVRVREDLDVRHLARIVEALGRRPTGC